MTEKKPAKKRLKENFKVAYVIPDHVQDLWVNGAYGGVTPSNEISMHLYSERAPVPKLVTHPIEKDGRILIDQEIGREIGGDAIRLIQSSILMDVNTAIAIR